MVPREQEHLTRFLESGLAGPGFQATYADLDLPQIQAIFQKATAPPAVEGAGVNLAPLPPTAMDSVGQADAATRERWQTRGLAAYQAGQVAIILLAGGQGTRLGSAEPKGCYNIGLPSQKSLFQMQGERIAKLQQLAGPSAPLIPWYVMTSGPTRAATEAFFAAHHHFGLRPEQVTFFEQGVLPTFDLEGRIIIEDASTISVAPDGNGGIYAALVKEGVLTSMRQRGVRYVHAYCVDNCLVKVGDPLFVGYCIEKDVDCGAKAVPKSFAEEPVGVICLKNGKPAVVEYSEIDKATATATHADGRLVYGAANIANHFYTLAFLDSIAGFAGELQYHVARKKIKYYDPATQASLTPKAPNGTKLELFIFDVFPFAKRFAVLLGP